MEIEKVSHMTGFGVRSIRDYLLGDDLRRVDWKLSAKHDRLLIREYSAVISFSPLIIVDLPLRDTPYSRIDFERMVAAVAGIVEKTVRASDKVSVLLVSGPNILHLIEKEKDLDRCLSELREWLHPAEQNEFFYRFSDRSELREHLRRISSGSGGQHSREAAVPHEPGPDSHCRPAGTENTGIFRATWADTGAVWEQTKSFISPCPAGIRALSARSSAWQGRRRQAKFISVYPFPPEKSGQPG